MAGLDPAIHAVPPAPSWAFALPVPVDGRVNPAPDKILNYSGIAGQNYFFACLRAANQFMPLRLCLADWNVHGELSKPIVFFAK
jgi:hypothetical protein